MTAKESVESGMFEKIKRIQDKLEKVVPSLAAIVWELKCLPLSKEDWKFFPPATNELKELAEKILEEFSRPKAPAPEDFSKN
jgi:hypothetical protein